VGKRAAAADWLPDDLLLSVLSHLPQREANLCEGAVLLTSRCVEALALVCLFASLLALIRTAGLCLALDAARRPCRPSADQSTLCPCPAGARRSGCAAMAPAGAAPAVHIQVACLKVWPFWCLSGRARAAVPAWAGASSGRGGWRPRRVGAAPATGCLGAAVSHAAAISAQVRGQQI
jgi:hypothetical protein